MKADIRSEIKALRFQMAKLETRCKDREDKLIKVLLILEPFLGPLDAAMDKKLGEELDLITSGEW